MVNSPGSADFKTLVLQATDIVELIGRTVALKRAGKDYKGLCPFHQEKSPSFTVSPTKQFFHCYGCKAGGNAIDFVIKRDRIEFIDALKQLAQQAGIEMPRYGVSKEKAGERQMLLDTQSAACAFFEKVLADPQQGAAAREYLKQRGISDESVRRFQIGLATESWDALLKGPVGRKFAPDLLLKAGLVKQRERGDGYYDTFRNRLIFPIRDREGRVIAFGGRAMPGSQDPAKYLNSPETPLFSKSNSIFGIDLARQKIVETRTAVVVEGYTDVVIAHQFGVSQVVSVLGTAMTEQHVSQLRRYLPETGGRIVLLFDADAAGDTAVERTVALFLTQPVEIAIASTPPGVDPDEFLLKEGAEAFEKLLADAPDALSYKWKQFDRQFNEGGNDLTGQQKAVEAYLQLLAAARGAGPVDPVRWGMALARVSRLTDIPVEQLNRRFRTGNRMNRGAPAPVGNDKTSPAPGPHRPLTARDQAERRILGVLLLKPKRWAQVQQSVDVADFTEDARRRLAEMYWAHQRDEGEPVFNEFLGLLGDSALQELAIDVVNEVESLPELDTTLADSIDHIERGRHSRDKLVAKLRRTSDEPLSEQDEVALFRALQDNARRPDLGRA